MKDEDKKKIINEIKSSDKDYVDYPLDSKFWDDKYQNKWQTHEALGTNGHENYSHYKDDVDIEIMMVLIEDSNEEIGLYYIEESFDNMDSEFAFDKYNKENNIVRLFSSAEKCEEKICELLSNKTNKSKEYFQEFFS